MSPIKVVYAEKKAMVGLNLKISINFFECFHPTFQEMNVIIQGMYYSHPRKLSPQASYSFISHWHINCTGNRLETHKYLSHLLIVFLGQSDAEWERMRLVCLLPSHYHKGIGRKVFYS